MIRFILGYVLKIEAVLMLLPCLTAVVYREPEGIAYLLTAALSFALGFLMSRKKPASSVFYLKEGCVATSLSWVFLSLFGALPFLITGEIPSVTDALFETISGFTTTGASILSDVEALSYCSLFWRSFTHWIGGMGVLVFLLAVIPLSGGSHINLMRAESPGPSVGKLVPKIRYTARILYLIYLGLTLLEVLLLLAGHMSLFEALTTSFGTAGTGGFGIKNDGLASYTNLQQSIVTIAMILFGVNFNVYYLLLRKRASQAFKMTEVRVYLVIIAISILLITINVAPLFPSVYEAFHHTAFQVASIITTTGFSTRDFNMWPPLSQTILVIIMFIGACAGSTGGGIKVSRIILLLKGVRKEILMTCHPRSVKKLKIDGHSVSHEVIRSINAFIIIYAVIFVISLLIISLDSMDLVTNFTAVAATLNNIGPGLNVVGPTGNFSSFSDLSKFVLMFDMLAGRLELMPMLILFVPSTWKK